MTENNRKDKNGCIVCVFKRYYVSVFSKGIMSLLCQIIKYYYPYGSLLSLNQMELTVQQKEKYLNVSRWFDHIQHYRGLRHHLPPVVVLRNRVYPCSQHWPSVSLWVMQGNLLLLSLYHSVLPPAGCFFCSNYIWQIQITGERETNKSDWFVVDCFICFHLRAAQFRCMVVPFFKFLHLSFHQCNKYIYKVYTPVVWRMKRRKNAHAASWGSQTHARGFCSIPTVSISCFILF